MSKADPFTLSDKAMETLQGEEKALADRLKNIGAADKKEIAAAAEEMIKELDKCAIMVILQGARIIVNEKPGIKTSPFSEKEHVIIGSALRWIALRNPMMFTEITKAFEEVKTPESRKLIEEKTGEDPLWDEKKLGMPYPKTETPTPGGRRRVSRQRGGLGFIPILLGAIALYFTGSTMSDISSLREQRDGIRAASLVRIDASCPIHLSIPVEPKGLTDWGGKHARNVAIYNHDKAVCEAVKTIENQHIVAATNAVDLAWTAIPVRAGALTTAAALAVAGTAGVITGPVFVSAVATGVAVQQVMSNMVAGQIPAGADLTNLVSTLAGAFPEGGVDAGAVDFAIAAAAAPGAPGAAAQGAPSPGRRGFKGARKTRKQRSKRRVTRRTKFLGAPVFVY
jgi:hypothetical protein